MPSACGLWLALQDDVNLFGVIADAFLPYIAVSCSPESRCALFFSGVLGQAGFVTYHPCEVAGSHCSGWAGIARSGGVWNPSSWLPMPVWVKCNFSSTLFPSSVLNGKKISVDFSPRCSPGAGFPPFDTKQKMKTVLSLGRSTRRGCPQEAVSLAVMS